MNAFHCAGWVLVVLLGGCDARQPPAPAPKTEAPRSEAVLPAAPPAPVVVSTLDKPVAEAVSAPAAKPAVPVHELAPNVPVVPVMLDGANSAAARSSVPVLVDAGKSAHVQARAEPPRGEPKKSEPGKGELKKDALKKDEPKKTDSVKAVPEKPLARREGKAQPVNLDKIAVKDVKLGKVRLDLSLPPDMVRELKPPSNVITGRRKPLLPPMFGDKAASRESSGFELNGRLLSNEMQLQMRNESRRDVEGAALDFKFKQ